MDAEYLLTLRDDGVAELERNGRQIWASDSDEELIEDLGKRALNLEGSDMQGVVRYLIEAGKLPSADACDVEIPDDDPIWDELDEEEDEEDEEDEEEDEEDD